MALGSRVLQLTFPRYERAMSTNGLPEADHKWYMLGVEIAGQMGDLQKDVKAENGEAPFRLVVPSVVHVFVCSTLWRAGMLD